MKFTDAIVKSFVQPERRPNWALNVTDLGSNSQFVLDRLNGVKPAPLGTDVSLKMASGIALEKDTIERIMSRGGFGSYQANFPLFNALWSGMADLVVDHGGRIPTILEHKATGNEYVAVPKDAHVYQILMYGELYAEMFGVQPDLFLIYRGWDWTAEFQLSLSNGVIYWRGDDAADWSRKSHLDLAVERTRLEGLYMLWQARQERMEAPSE